MTSIKRQNFQMDGDGYSCKMEDLCEQGVVCDNVNNV
jgi:hypothetical protein